MLSIGIIYPEIKILSNIKNIVGLEQKSLKQDNSRIIQFEELENINLLISSIDDEFKNDENDFGIVLTDRLNNRKTYFLKILKIVSQSENNLTVIAFTFGASKGVIKSWTQFYSKGVNEPKLWKKLKGSERQGWLELAMSFQNVKNSNLIEEVIIDGENINHIDDFYCELGESINGFGGYFGRNPNALIDCIISPEFGGNDLKRIIWKNHKKSIWKLKRNYNMILEIFKDYNIEVILQ